jgi:hypothetical protein
VGQALQFLSQVGRADQNRLLVLRSASDHTVQPEDETPAEFLASDVSGGLSGFLEALNDVYQVGSLVVKEISSHWDTYVDQTSSGPISASGANWCKELSAANTRSQEPESRSQKALPGLANGRSGWSDTPGNSGLPKVLILLKLWQRVCTKTVITVEPRKNEN